MSTLLHRLVLSIELGIVQTGTGKVDPARKFKCPTSARLYSLFNGSLCKDRNNCRIVNIRNQLFEFLTVVFWGLLVRVTLYQPEENKYMFQMSSSAMFMFLCLVKLLVLLVLRQPNFNDISGPLHLRCISLWIPHLKPRKQVCAY